MRLFLYNLIFFNALMLGANALAEPVEGAAKNERRHSAVTFSANYQNLNPQRAYQLQKAYVRNQAIHGMNLVGFKMELNNKQKQQQYQVDSPITGVLLEPALSSKQAIVLQLSENPHLMIKQGLAFKLAKPIKNAVQSVEQLQAVFTEAAAVVELPDFNFADQAYNGLDIIANNAMANQFILGEWRASNKNLDQITYQLTCNDTIIAQGDNSSLSVGQWQSLLWMVNHLLEQGYSLRKGQIFLTGAFAGMLSAQSCLYSAEFADFGNIQFRVE